MRSTRDERQQSTENESQTNLFSLLIHSTHNGIANSKSHELRRASVLREQIEVNAEENTAHTITLSAHNGLLRPALS